FMTSSTTAVYTLSLHDALPILRGTARLLLDSGADPNTRDGVYGVAALHGVTGERSVPGIAEMLLKAGANPNDGESLFHAAEKARSEEHTSELQSLRHLVCRLLL